MDFVVGLPKTQLGHNVVWVIMDRLTKSAHFLPGKVNYDLNKLVELYVKEIMTPDLFTILVESVRSVGY